MDSIVWIYGKVMIEKKFRIQQEFSSQLRNTDFKQRILKIKKIKNLPSTKKKKRFLKLIKPNHSKVMSFWIF